MGFLKSVAKWASIWTVVAVVFLVIQDLRDGKAIDLAQVIGGTVVIWLVMAALVTLSKVRRAARRVGSDLGHATFAAAKTAAGTRRDQKSGTLSETQTTQPGRTRAAVTER